MQETFETCDIFRSAYLLCMNCELESVHLEQNGKRSVVFKICGEDLTQLDLNFRNGNALVNPLHLREALNLLRDLMFKKIRSQETRERKIYHESHKSHESQKSHKGHIPH